MPSANWHCELGGILISGVGQNEVNSMRRDPGRDPGVGPYRWYDNLRGLQGIVDHAVKSGQPGYLYFTEEGSTRTRCLVGAPCSLTAGNFSNHGFFSSISQGLEDDQSTIRGEYQLVVPRYAAVNEYIHDDASILDGRWLHADTLSPPDSDTKGQAIGVWLFQSGPNTLSVIARERSSQGGSDFLVGYEVILDRRIQKEKARVGPVRLIADTGPLDGITGSAPFLLTNFDEGNLFHLLVPREDKVSREFRIEYYVQRESILGQWTHLATLQPPSDDPRTTITAVTFVQSTQRKFEAVARVTPPNQGDDYLVGYELDLGALTHQAGWSPPFKLVTDTGLIGVTGSPIIIESTSGEEDLFHLLVPTKDVTVHYTLAVGSFGDGSDGHWKSFATLNSFHDLPVTAVSLVENLVGGFEAVTRVQLPGGDEMVVGYELQPGSTQWSDSVALDADDGPILAGKPTPPVDEPPTNSIG